MIFYMITLLQDTVCAIVTICSSVRSQMIQRSTCSSWQQYLTRCANMSYLDKIVSQRGRIFGIQNLSSRLGAYGIQGGCIGWMTSTRNRQTPASGNTVSEVRFSKLLLFPLKGADAFGRGLFSSSPSWVYREGEDQHKPVPQADLLCHWHFLQSRDLRRVPLIVTLVTLCPSLHSRCTWMERGPPSVLVHNGSIRQPVRTSGAISFFLSLFLSAWWTPD